ncbi:MAG: hypothetical protein L6R41_001015 [Letrouitia leprolyta]|nr:MAG: hypothetical protein L6R41_001015 [Letrouitia leprolyta]
MAPAKLTCRLRVKKVQHSDDNSGQLQEAAILPLRDCPEIGTEIRTRWANEVMKHFEQTEEPHISIRPRDFLAGLDGSIESLPVPGSEGDLIDRYSVRFQIPANNLDGLDREEKVRRTELFAMASLLYEIMTGRQPLEGLTDEEVQHRFINGDFPDDAVTLPNSLFIFSGWSAEFSQELTRRVKSQDVTLFQAMKNNAKAHPVLTGLRIVGATFSVLSFCAVPALGAIGFTAAGPAANSVAAAWQASMGVVKAGSLFSWCQSAAMGGGALGGIKAAGIAGTALTKVGDLPELMKTFRRSFPNSKQME